MANTRILDIVSKKYPELDPPLALLALHRKQGDIYSVATILGCSASGVWRVIDGILTRGGSVKKIGGKSKQGKRR